MLIAVIVFGLLLLAGNLSAVYWLQLRIDRAISNEQYWRFESDKSLGERISALENPPAPAPKPRTAAVGKPTQPPKPRGGWIATKNELERGEPEAQVRT